MWGAEQVARWYHMKTFRIIVKGRVQGVGFRYFVLDKALKTGITGTVENLYGTRDVEIFCSGEGVNLEKFIQEIRKGPALSKVIEIKINPCEEKDSPDFRII